MPAKTKSPKGTGNHTPVQNRPEVLASENNEKSVSEEPSKGINKKATKVAEDGSEAVKGYQPVRVESAAMSELFSAPASEDLRDIGEASFGPPPPTVATVIGADDRVKIANTSILPWRMNASLLITAKDNSTWIGTGWFIGPHTLVTAGHCVHIKNSGVPGRDGWVKSINVMPGRNGSTLPFGSVTSTNFRAVTGWTNNGDPEYDYGAILIPTQLGNTTGWYGFGVYTDTDLLTVTANISGYPGDKPSGTQWYHSRKVTSVGARKVYYDIDTAGGQSGSAVYRILGDKRIGIAIHAYGVGGSSNVNSGTRITNVVYNNLVAWKA
jgi:V8-like Glu-specific endopeptidase